MTSSTVDASQDRTGLIYLQLMFVMATWGLNIVSIKYLTQHMDIRALAALRIAVAFVAVTLIVKARRGRIPRLGRVELAWVALAGFLVVYAHQTALVYGLQFSSAANGTLLMATSPLLSALLAALFYRERLTWLRIAGALLGLAGVAMVVVGSGAQIGLTGWGDAIVFLAVAVFVFGGLVIQRISRTLDPLAMLWYMYLAGGLMLMAHAAMTPSSYDADNWSMTWWPWLVLLFSAVIASGVSNILWNAGIARLGISRAALFVNWLPIFGLLFAALFLDEHVTLVHVAGLACILSGTWLGLRRGAPASR
ncbi:Probable amino-acid metabolite efflux pump [Achromobacter xylosoxidans]|nr:Permease of the drug/metabolite transporter (DMT) superfamily [Achromobacter xylosoxidans NH44784-1996]CUI92118.1 Probable amino-acid metabolite efflux pump [Achromobacter xylosoxidans]CUJ03276.1 Probable amino-acid metabolite efflux pump [Achromobacter xylosoxidans]CUJ14110.1 Probable amino-acid metabolite efflux pump [Achromobacter xylosoxidans]CUJ33813.1 Probable amino-acid metabolite efflux pump [Achromobacter xylosoxidans]